MHNAVLTYFILFLILLSVSIGFCQTQEVFGTIQGQVTDKHNNPLSDYVISVVSQTDNITYSAKTNSGGQFTITNLPVGTWDLIVQHFSTLLAQREITVEKETEVETNFVIKGTGVISGFLLESISNLPLPISGEIQVGLLSHDAERIESIFRVKVSNGCFEVNNLLSGHYVIIDAFDSYVLAKNDSPVVTVYPEGHVGGVEVFLKRGASLHGRFVDADNGNIIPGVFISAASEKSNSIYADGELTYETETETKGEFQISIPNDSETYYAFTLIASHPQYQTQRWRWEMSPDKDIYALGELSLEPFLSLHGKVVSFNSHQTVARLKVQLIMHHKSTDFFRGAAQLEHTVYTDVDGDFLFTELHPIEYSLTISQNDVIIGFLESVNPHNKKLLKIHLQELKKLFGTVVDTQHRPIANAKIYASRQNENPHGHGAILSMTQTDVNGTFQMLLLDTKPHLLSVEVTKEGFLSRVYPTVEIGNNPLVVPLHEGIVIQGRVILPNDHPSDGYYEVKIFPTDTRMEATLNPLSLIRPILSRRFPVTEQTFVLEGLFEEKYSLFITGPGIAATGIEVNATPISEEVLIVADKQAVGINGQVLWEDTGEPVHNAIVSRSWYPWELSRYDMSLTLDRFETDTDSQGNFAFTNLTQGRYMLQVRVVRTEYVKESENYQRNHIQKKVIIPTCSNTTYRIFLGKSDGTPFVR